jgi:uncharacterized protein (TIGR03435 family)
VAAIGRVLLNEDNWPIDIFERMMGFVRLYGRVTMTSTFCTRRFFLFLTCLLLVLSGMLHAQTIAGAWQGALPIPVNPRIVVRFAKADDGSLDGVFYRIDQSDSSIPFSTVTFVAPELSLFADLMDISFRGKLSPDGKSIAGTWTQGKTSYPMIFVLVAPGAVWKHEAIVPLPPMAENAGPAFEVATIKPSPPDGDVMSYSIRTRHFTAHNATLADLMKFAYKIRDRQISGAPEWINETKVDVAAEPDKVGQPSEDQFRLMVRKMLADRFQLKAHSAQKLFPVYALTVEKNVAKLNKSNADFNSHVRIFTKEEPGSETRVQFAYASMAEFVNMLMDNIQERQIVDETGLAGRYDFTLMIPTSALQADTSDNEKATVFISAVQPVGLKLVSKQAMLEVVVIDHVEKPSAN